MRKRILSIALTAMLTIGMTTITKAATIDKTQSLLTAALNDVNFYTYNMAYAAILTIGDTNEQAKMLNSLSKVSSQVWTNKIKYYNSQIDILAKEGSIKVYYNIHKEIYNDKSLKEVERNYLLSECFKLSEKLIFTPDYDTALKEVERCKVALENDLASIPDRLISTNRLINQVQNPINKQYLLEELAKTRTEFEKMSVNIEAIVKISELAKTLTSSNEPISIVKQMAELDSTLIYPEMLSEANISTFSNYIAKSSILKAGYTDYKSIKQAVKVATSRTEADKIVVQDTQLTLPQNTESHSIDITNQIYTLSSALDSYIKMDIYVSNFTPTLKEFITIDNGKILLNSKSLNTQVDGDIFIGVKCDVISSHYLKVHVTIK